MVVQGREEARLTTIIGSWVDSDPFIKVEEKKQDCGWETE